MRTKSSGIRFKIDELEFIKKREQLTSAQQVVYFLCTEYCKLWRLEKKSVFDVREEPEQITAQKITPLKIRRTAATFYELLLECDSRDDYDKLAAEIEQADNLTRKEKNTLLKR